MKLFLHPGHAKCGSTSIQRAIIRNRKVLADRQIVVPDPQLRLPGEAGFNPHGETPREFFRHIMEKDDATLLEIRLDAWRESSRWRDATFLISAENLINHLMGPIGQTIHGLLAEAFEAVEVIYYIRRQDDYILSAWQQWGFKEGKKFEAYCAEAQRRRNPHYWAVTQALSQLYGREHVTVRPLCPEALKGGDLLTDFFGRLIQPVNSTALDLDRSRSNISLNPYFCEVLAEQRGLFKDIHDDHLKQRLLKALGPGSDLFRKEKSFMSPALAASIMAHHQEENHRLHQQFFPDVAYDTVFGVRQQESGLSDSERQALSMQRESELQKHVIWNLIDLLQASERESRIPA